MWLTIGSYTVHDRIGLYIRPGIHKIILLQTSVYFVHWEISLKWFDSLGKASSRVDTCVDIASVGLCNLPSQSRQTNSQTNRMYRQICSKIYCKEMAYILKEASKSVDMNLVYCGPKESIVQLVLILMQANLEPSRADVSV